MNSHLESKQVFFLLIVFKWQYMYDPWAKQYEWFDYGLKLDFNRNNKYKIKFGQNTKQRKLYKTDMNLMQSKS